MIDTYAKFEDLAAHATEGTDFRIVIQKTNSPMLIMAIHGGNIEPLTSELATSIAGDDCNYYLFEGLRSERNEELHIGSAYFDEPRAMDMIRGAETIVTIHGHADAENEFVMVGGLAETVAARITSHLQEIDIVVRPFEEQYHPDRPENICNRGMSGAGVELEISKKLRDALREDTGLYRMFTNAVRNAIRSEI